MLLRPDFTFYLKGIRVRRYDLTQHNPNAIPMPTAVMDRDSIVGITIHNTNRKPPLYSMGTAEQCVWKTMHQELKDVRVHFYVDEYGAWQTLPLQLAGWHATDGAGNGNNVINLKRLLNGKQNVWKYQNGEEKSDSDGREKDV